MDEGGAAHGSTYAVTPFRLLGRRVSGYDQGGVGGGGSWRTRNPEDTIANETAAEEIEIVACAEGLHGAVGGRDSTGVADFEDVEAFVEMQVSAYFVEDLGNVCVCCARYRDVPGVEVFVCKVNYDGSWSAESGCGMR